MATTERSLSPLTLVWNDAEHPRWRDTRGHRRRTPHVPRFPGLQPRLLRTFGLSIVSVIRQWQAENVQVSGYLHLPTHSPRPLKRSLWPAAYAGESGDVSRGIPSSEMITDAQYAPLPNKKKKENLVLVEYPRSSASLRPAREQAAQASMGYTYRTSSSPPTTIWKPPSACFSEQSHFHIARLSTTLYASSPPTSMSASTVAYVVAK